MKQICVESWSLKRFRNCACNDGDTAEAKIAHESILLDIKEIKRPLQNIYSRQYLDA